MSNLITKPEFIIILQAICILFSLLIMTLFVIKKNGPRYVVKKVDLGESLFLSEDAYINLLAVLERVRARNKAIGLPSSDYLHLSDVRWLDEIVGQIIKHETTKLNRASR